jgi:predicted nucleotidyltransferase
VNSLLAETIASFLKSKQSILFAYLFGSQASGNVNPMSDLDVAVYTDSAATPNELWCLQSEIMEAACIKRVDLIDLRRAPPVLVYEIVSTGKLLFSGDAEAVNRFERKAYLHYFDTQHLRDVQNYYLRAHFIAS